MPPMNLPFRILGRPLKPVALGLTIITSTIGWTEFAHAGAFGDSAWAHPLTALAAITSILFVWGWWGRSQQVAEWALLFAASTMIFRSTGLFLTLGPEDQRTWLSFGVGVIAIGSYALERLDTTTGKAQGDAA